MGKLWRLAPSLYPDLIIRFPAHPLLLEPSFSLFLHLHKCFSMF